MHQNHVSIIDFSTIPLQERMQLISKLYTKIGMVQEKVERIPKNGYNEHHKYSFATQSDILAGIRPILAEAKLAIRPTLLSETEEFYEKGARCKVEMLFMIVDMETGYVEYTEMTGRANDIGDKGIYKAYTGCQKYFYTKTFNIETGDDPENEDVVITEGNGGGNRSNGNRNNRNDRNRNDRTRGNSGNRNQTPQDGTGTPPPTGSKDAPKPITGDLVVAVDKLIRDFVTVGNGTKEAVIAKLQEKVGAFEKIESMTLFQGTRAKDQLTLWYNRKLKEINEAAERDAQDVQNPPQQAEQHTDNQTPEPTQEPDTQGQTQPQDDPFRT